MEQLPTRKKMVSLPHWCQFNRSIALISNIIYYIFPESESDSKNTKLVHMQNSWGSLMNLRTTCHSTIFGQMYTVGNFIFCLNNKYETELASVSPIHWFAVFIWSICTFELCTTNQMRAQNPVNSARCCGGCDTIEKYVFFTYLLIQHFSL